MPATERLRQRGQRSRRVGMHTDGTPLDGVERRHVDRHQLGLCIERMRAGRKVLQACTDANHDIGLGRQRVRRDRTRHADRTGEQRVIPRQRALAAMRFANRNTVLFGKRLQRRRAALAVKRTAAGNQNRPLGLPENLGDGFDFERFRLRRAEVDDALGKELFRPVGGHRLHVLRERQRHRAALGRIGEHGDGARQGSQKLKRRDDAVEVTRNRTQTVGGRDVSVLEVFDLLQYGIRRTRDEDVARQQQHRQAIDVRRTGGCDEIGAARPDRRSHRHHAAAEVGLGVGDGGERHALFVVRTEGWESLLDRMQRLTQTGHIAMPENRPHTAKQRLRTVFREHFLRHQIAHQRLRHRQPNRSHSHTSIIYIQLAGCFHHARIGTRKT